MGRRWRCVNGHSDKGPLALPACPVCGLPVTVEPDRPAVAARPAALPPPEAPAATPLAAIVDDTLVGQLPGADLAEGPAERSTQDQKTRVFPPSEPARDNGSGN